MNRIKLTDNRSSQKQYSKWIIVALIVGLVLGSTGMLDGLLGLVGDAVELYMYVFILWLVLALTHHTNNRLAFWFSQLMRPLENVMNHFRLIDSYWWAPVSSIVVLFIIAHTLVSA